MTRDVPRILVGCPTYAGKEYAMRQWLEAVRAFTYPNFEVVMVDNSEGNAFYDRWKNEVRLLQCSSEGTPHQRIARGMEVLRKLALNWEHPFDYWLSLEADILAPPHTASLMLKWLEAAGQDCVIAPFPIRGGGEVLREGFSCTLFNRNCLRVSFDDAPADRFTDGWYLQQLRHYRLKVYQLPLKKLPLVHLDYPEGPHPRASWEEQVAWQMQKLTQS